MRGTGRAKAAIRVLAACAVAATFLLAAAAGAETPRRAPESRLRLVPGGPCAEGTLAGDASDAQWRICVPADWNGDLVVYAHGFVAPSQPLRLPDDRVGGLPVDEIIQSMGFAYATTSYRTNGLAVPLAVEDLVQLVERFGDEFVQPLHVFAVGVSEGGLVAALAVEKYPEMFDAGLSAGGPVGDFRNQVNYFGDFLVLFNYFFPNVLPNCTPLGISKEVMDNWESVYEPAVREALSNQFSATRQLLRVTRIPIDPMDPSSIAESVTGILRYAVFATNNAIRVLGGGALWQPGQPGQPFDNTRRFYTGSDNDLRLNLAIQRVAAGATAIKEIETRYQTSGRLSRPMITIHTTDDPIVPFAQQPAYGWKTIQAGSGSLNLGIPVFRYGHVNLTLNELHAAFSAMLFASTSQNLFTQIVPALRLRISQQSPE